MNIAMIGQKGLPAKFGGVERHVHDLSVRLVQRGHTVTAYARTWYADGDLVENVDGVRVRYTPTLHTKHFDTIIHTFVSTFDALRRDIDVIHYHGVGPSLLSWIPRILRPDVRVVNTFHSIDRKHEKWGFIARMALKIGEWASCAFSHDTIAVSRTIQQYARDVYDSQLVYVPNAVEIKKQQTDAEILSMWGLKPQEYVLMVSRLIPHKGAHYLIDAWKKLEGTKARGKKKLVIVGDGYYTDAYVQSLQEMAKDDESIVFTGFQSGKALEELFSHAKLMVHPSDNEGMPIVVLEGMSYGLPLLVSNIVEHRDLIQDFTYQFDAQDVDSLMKKMSALLLQSKDELKKEGQKNKKHIKREYAWDVIIDKVEAVYEKQGAQGLALFSGSRHMCI